MKLVPSLVLLALAVPALSQTPTEAGTRAIMQPQTTPATQSMDGAPAAPVQPTSAYPPCTARLTDKCIEPKVTGATPTRKAIPARVARKDKVHRRTG